MDLSNKFHYLDNKEISFREGEVNIIGLMNTINRNKKLISAIVFIFAFLGSIFGYSQPRIWKGEFEIVKNDNPQNRLLSKSLNDIQNTNSNLLEVDKYDSIKKEIEIFKSPIFLQSIYEFINKNQGTSYSASRINKDIKITNNKDTFIYKVTYQNKDKEVLNLVLKEILDKFQEYSSLQIETDFEKTKLILEKQINSLEESIQPHQEKMDNFDGLLNSLTKEMEETNSVKNFRIRESKLAEQIEPIKTIMSEMELPKSKLMIISDLEFDLIKLKSYKLSSSDPWKIISKPFIYDEHISPTRWIYPFAFIIFGTFVGVLYAFYKEKRSGSVYEDVIFERILKTQIIYKINFQKKPISDINIFLKELILFEKEEDSIKYINCGTIQQKSIERLFKLIYGTGYDFNNFNELTSNFKKANKLIMIAEIGKTTLNELIYARNFLEIINKKPSGIILITN